MPTTLNNGIQLPDKGSVDWYSSMQSNYNLIDTHLGNTDIHVTAEDKANWDSKQGSLSQAQLDAIAQVATNTSDIATLQSGKANASHTHSSSDITDIGDYATKQYVDNSISGLVDSAPNALDTLNELAAALNDDANFASTVATALSAKANSADLATVATSGSYTDLSNKPTINDSTITIQKNGSLVGTFTVNGSAKTINIPVPTKTSDLTNDSNFVVSSNLATIATSGDYDDLGNKPSIPTNTSDLNNDSGFVTLNDFDIPSKTSDLTNDSGFITSSNIPTGTSDLINDSNFVDTSNPAVASGITSAKVTDYDTHIADTDIHVTTADKTKWNNNVTQSFVFRYSSTALVASSTNSNALLDNTDNLKVGDKVLDSSGNIYVVTAIDTANSTFTIGTSLIDLAQDSDVVHKSGDETVTGIKSFSDDTFVKSLNNTREVTSPSSSSTVVLPIVVTVTYTDQSPSQTATLNLRVSADGSKTLYPNENGVYSLGLVSRNWDNVYSYMFEAFGKYLGNEFSGNARTNLYLKANRDTGGQSGVYISKFRQNRAQGEMSGSDVVQVTFDVLENSVRSNRLWYLNWVNWENDVPKTVEVRSLCEKVDYKLTHINGLEPSALGMPDLDNGIDISSYIPALDSGGNTQGSYTPNVNGFITFRGIGNGCSIIQGNMGNNVSYVTDPQTSNRIVNNFLPVVKDNPVVITARGLTSIEFIYFYPCQGNV